MSIPSLKARLSFQAKVLVPVLTGMVLLMAAVMWVVNLRITQQVEIAAAQQLNVANTVFTNTQAIRAEGLVARYCSVIAEPSFKATISLFDRATTIQFLNDI